MLEDGGCVATRLEEGHRQLSSERSESLLVVIPQLVMTLTQTLHLIAIVAKPGVKVSGAQPR